MREPFPEPNSNLPMSMTGSKADVSLKCEPRANRIDPIRQSDEKRNNPTTKISIKRIINKNKY